MGLNLLILSSGVIGICFIFIAIMAAFLYFRRVHHWREAWSIWIVVLGMGSCGVSRIVHCATYFHWPRIGFEAMTLADTLTAIFAILSSMFCVPAFRILSNLPSMRDIEHAIRGNMQKKAAQAEAARLLKEKEKSERVSSILTALFRTVPNVSADLKEKVENVIAELKNDSDPPDNGGYTTDNGPANIGRISG